ncbi:hypothetical protein [Paenimyroides viscosum]|uniref:Conjugal transfer protein TraK n=1 Tax=Paenimyroides viscosum TaxID=2488729 RepID=A0A3P1B0N8_9FLAO|nr:hypothetical protein [Paenimyroides viscosum]MBS7321888.1 hypothetical protein [Myroides sp.]RRA93922.1 hypothetical protein EG242_09650 [Paenimyroides viscosum]
MKVGENIFYKLKRNNVAVYVMAVITLVSVVSSAYFSYQTYLHSRNHVYAIDSKGQMIPLTLIDQKKDRIRQVMANADLFVNYAYDIDAFNYKEKKEKLSWLLDNHVIRIFKNKENAGYYNQLLQYNIIQHAKVLPETMKWSEENGKYTLRFISQIQIINTGQRQVYNIQIKLNMIDVSINYPYNPYGLLIVDYVEENKVLIQDVEQLKEME